jgi:hypothetical protein
MDTPVRQVPDKNPKQVTTPPMSTGGNTKLKLLHPAAKRSGGGNGAMPKSGKNR